MVAHFRSLAVLISIHFLHSSAYVGTATRTTTPYPQVLAPGSLPGNASNILQGTRSSTTLSSIDITTPSRHPRLPADDALLAGYPKTPDSVLLKPAPTATRSLSKGNSAKSRTSGLHRRALSNPYEFIRTKWGKKVYTWPSVDRWLNYQIDNSISLAHGTLVTETITTGLTSPLTDTKESWSLVDLYGCTAVVVISNTRIYMSHIWESPTMLGSPEIFQKQALDALRNGDLGTPGLEQFVGKGGDFEDREGNDVHTFIITPVVHRLHRSQPNILRHPGPVNKIWALMRELHLHRGLTILPYISWRPDPLRERGNGKVLIQYDSKAETSVVDGLERPVAAIELWFESYREARFQKKWVR